MALSKQVAAPFSSQGLGIYRRSQRQAEKVTAAAA